MSSETPAGVIKAPAMKTVPPKTALLSWALLFVAIAGVSFLWGTSWMRQTENRARPALPVLATVPDFALTERSGRPVTLAGLRGHIWVADFIFTRCAGPCPMMSTRMAALQSSLTKATDVRLVTVTVDPAHDTTSVLQAYAKNYNASADQWLFLTGDEPAIRKLAREGFHLGMEKLPPAQRAADEGEILHSTTFSLVDRAGSIRGYYDGDDPQAHNRLLLDIGNLMREKMP